MDRKNKVIIIFVAVIIILLFIVLAKYIKRENELNDLNNMYNDIHIIEDAVSMYYLDNGSLPIKGDVIEFSSSINPNDDNNFYEIDLSLLDNLRLCYGRKQFGKNDIYIVNKKSQTVYYYSGVLYNKKIYYTREDVAYEFIDTEIYK